MRSYRALVWTTVVAVLSAAIGFPGAVLYRHRNAVIALKDRDSIYLSMTHLSDPPIVEVDWVNELFSTVDYVGFGEAVHVGDMRHLKNLRGLKSVDFDAVSDSAWPHLPLQVQTLGFILPADPANSAAWNQISRLQQLKELSISAEGKPISEHVPRLLDKLPLLATLRFNDVTLSRDDLQSLLIRKPKLETLEISSWEADGLVDSHIELISHHRGIKDLNIERNWNLTDASLEHLTKMPSLKVLYISAKNETNYQKGVFRTKLTDEGLEKLRRLRPANQPTAWRRDRSVLKSANGCDPRHQQDLDSLSQIAQSAFRSKPIDQSAFTGCRSKAAAMPMAERGGGS